MNKIILFLLFFSFILGSCSQKKDTSMIVDEENVLTFRGEHITSLNKWYNFSKNIYVDTLNLYNGEKSLRLSSSKEDSLNKDYIKFYFNLSGIDGDSISLRGKYKLKTTDHAKAMFILANVDTLCVESSNNSDWSDFYLKTSIDKAEIMEFQIEGKGDIDLSVSNCQAMIDGIPLSEFLDKEYSAEKDNEFDEGSNIKLGELTPQMRENLEVLGKVWGFLKYYHPKVTQGKYNWDYELFRVLPDIVNAKNKDERNKLTNKWIDKYGKIKKSADYTITDSVKYSRIINLDWLKNKEMFSNELIEKLQKIKNAKRSNVFSYYAIPEGSTLDKMFEQEKKYKNIKWNDQGFRILTLFRMWNAIEYCFPYTHYTDTPWETLLKQFIPQFVSPADQASYELAIMELGAKIDDSHGVIVMPYYNKLKETVIAPQYFRDRVPAWLTLSAEGYITVKSTQNDYLNRGDIILSVDGKTVETIIEEMSPYIISSNKNGLIRNILPYLLASEKRSLDVEIMRNGKRMLVKIEHFSWNKQLSGTRSWTEYNLEKKNIIFINNSIDLEKEKEMIPQIMDSKGLIIDMREYPRNNNWNIISPLVKSKYPLWISKNDYAHPGNYIILPGYDKINEADKDPNYKGIIVILVDEHTQSAGESSSMGYRLAPNSTIVGRQTAGANGGIGRIYLPGNIEFMYTQQGAYYPHWEILQRKGVKIDVHVSPTVQDIKEGRDVWIEKAIEIIEYY